MRNALSIVFLFVVLNVQAQTWQLFPYLQQSHYQSNKAEYGISTFTADSIKPLASGFVMYFNQKSDPHPCFAVNYFKLNRYNSTYPDSVVEKADTTKLYFGSKAFSFFHRNTGDSVVFSTFDNKKATLKFTDIAVETILGKLDSVRTYVLKNNGNSYTLKWSKKYGLLSYLNFYELYESAFPASIFSLIGYKGSNDSAGYQMPDVNDFLPYQPGNVYLRKYIYEYQTFPPSITFIRDSIITVTHTPEKITLTGISMIFRYGKDIDTVYNFSSEIPKQLWNIPAGEKGFLSEKMRTEKLVWNSKPALLRTSDSATIRCFYADYTLINDTDCTIRQMTDTDLKICYCSGIGEVYRESWMFSTMTDSLIGWKTPTSSYGSLNFPVGQEELEIPQTPLIYPNPANDVLFIHSTIEKGNITIFNIVGGIVMQQALESNQVNISKLTPGIYLFHLRTINREYNTRFIKE
jgi:hypothetical protein